MRAKLAAWDSGKPYSANELMFCTNRVLRGHVNCIERHMAHIFMTRTFIKLMISRPG